MRPGLFLALLVVAPAVRADHEIEWKPPTFWEVVPLVLVEGAMAIDGLQALDLKNHNRAEMNPLLGRHPTDARIYATVGAGMLVVGAIWYFMPSKLRVIMPIAIFVVEVPTIIDNATHYDLVIRF